MLVDTSVWVDHLHAAEPLLVEALGDDAVVTHPLVAEELAAGNIRRRDDVLAGLAHLRSLAVLDHREYLALVDRRRLWGRGLGPVDLHLVGSALLDGSQELWTRDRRLREVASELGIPVVDA